MELIEGSMGAADNTLNPCHAGSRTQQHSTTDVQEVVWARACVRRLRQSTYAPWCVASPNFYHRGQLNIVPRLLATRHAGSGIKSMPQEHPSMMR